VWLMFAYEVFLVDRKPDVYDHTNGLVGAGYITDYSDYEEAFIKVNQMWERHHPGLKIHVEQISAREFTTGRGC